MMGRRHRTIGRTEATEEPLTETPPCPRRTSQDARRPQRTGELNKSTDTRFIQVMDANCPMESRTTDGGRRGGGTSRYFHSGTVIYRGGR